MFTRPIPLPITCGLRIVIGGKERQIGAAFPLFSPLSFVSFYPFVFPLRSERQQRQDLKQRHCLSGAGHWLMPFRQQVITK